MIDEKDPIEVSLNSEEKDEIDEKDESPDPLLTRIEELEKKLQNATKKRSRVKKPPKKEEEPEPEEEENEACPYCESNNIATDPNLNMWGCYDCGKRWRWTEDE